MNEKQNVNEDTSGDELDNAIIAADDTGMLETQHEILEEEIAEGEDPGDDS